MTMQDPPDLLKQRYPTQWIAFAMQGATPVILKAKHQDELKKLLNERASHLTEENVSFKVLSIVRGSEFGIKIQSAFTFVDNPEIDISSHPPIPGETL